MTSLKVSVLVFVCAALAAGWPPASLRADTAAPAGSVVKFNSEGITMVDGKPFFPVGIYLYSLSPQVMADVHQQQFNTIVNISGASFGPDQLDYIYKQGMMAVEPVTDQWLAAARNHPSLLAWYLTDEPEGHGDAAATERQRYLLQRIADPNHPVGLTHYLFNAIAEFKDACDFTMLDVYPITANRDTPIVNVGIHIDEAHRVHGRNWPVWSWIQVFGGPNTDGGKWAVPLPYEVRCMTYIALVHGATGILYFSYWPQEPVTWNSIGPLNSEIYRMEPWLVAPGKELKTDVQPQQIQVRARQVARGGIVIAVNTGPAFTDARITVPGMRAGKLYLPFENRTVLVRHGVFKDTFGPNRPHVYTWGEEPDVTLATTH